MVQSNTVTIQRKTRKTTTVSKPRADGERKGEERTKDADPDKVEQRRHLKHPAEQGGGGIRSVLVIGSMDPGRAVRPATRVPGASIVVVRKVRRVVGMRGRGRSASLEGGPYTT